MRMTKQKKIDEPTPRAYIYCVHIYIKKNI